MNLYIKKTFIAFIIVVLTTPIFLESRGGFRGGGYGGYHAGMGGFRGPTVGMRGGSYGGGRIAAGSRAGAGGFTGTRTMGVTHPTVAGRATTAGLAGRNTAVAGRAATTGAIGRAPTARVAAASHAGTWSGKHDWNRNRNWNNWNRDLWGGGWWGAPFWGFGLGLGLSYPWWGGYGYSNYGSDYSQPLTIEEQPTIIVKQQTIVTPQEQEQPIQKTLPQPQKEAVTQSVIDEDFGSEYLAG